MSGCAQLFTPFEFIVRIFVSYVVARQYITRFKSNGLRCIRNIDFVRFTTITTIIPKIKIKRHGIRKQNRFGCRFSNTIMGLDVKM